MNFNRVLITGGAGFVGSNLAVLLRQRFPVIHCTAFDNLKRRGSELSLLRLRQQGVHFVHGDVRCAEDLEALEPFDLLIDCSAEPSVYAAHEENSFYVLDANLVGTIRCLEAARRHGAAFLFLSTSRVYPIHALNALRYAEEATRFQLAERQDVSGATMAGIREDFPLAGPRSLYGASKLAGELLLQEYVFQYGLKGLINRCGLLAGPWQMGKVDQGVVALWVARHHFVRPLQYIGFGGEGKQVRDILHVADLFELIVQQMEASFCWDGRIYNVGGGLVGSVSLCELSLLCREATGHVAPLSGRPETSPLDVRIYVTDSGQVRKDFNWEPKRSPMTIVADICAWLRDHEDALAPLFA